MIPKECKRLAEVDFPIAMVSKHSASDKYVRHKPNTSLHPWWAQRPLASCRAMILGLLLPDPCDSLCPLEFKAKVRETFHGFLGVREGDKGLRRALLTFIGDVANWDVANNPRWISVARALVKAAFPNEMPLVVDPFAGAGSIPLEALRLGSDAFASDLNSVACLILKTMLEDIPRQGSEAAEELRRVGDSIKKHAEKVLSDFYPKDSDEATPIAYLWARTVRCESPNCGAVIPLVRSYWLCKKEGRYRALRHEVLRTKNNLPHVEFRIFEPKSKKEVPDGTVTRAKAACICCGTVLPPERVRAQLAEQHGGADVIFDKKGARIGGALILAVVTLHPKADGRKYRLPTEQDYQAIWKAQERLKKIISEWEKGNSKVLCPFPNEPLPPIGTLGFRVQRYGMLQWGDLFTARQKIALLTIAGLIQRLPSDDLSSRSLAAFSHSKFARHLNANARWNNVIESVEPAFGQQTLPITWTFPESVPWGPWAENYDGSVEAVARTVERGFFGVDANGQTEIADATNHPLPDTSCDVWFTDPPYYDAVPYSDLSDFFFVWLKRSLPSDMIKSDPFDSANTLTSKSREIVQDETKQVHGRRKDKIFFEERMALAFREGRRILSEDGIGCVVFAHKSTEGWEALVTGMIGSGWVVTSSWPIATERAGRLRARDSAALSASVHLVCRPRSNDAPVGDWGEVLDELPQRVGDWMERLQGEGIRGADLVFACIGPALEIFSRYSNVETAEGKEVTLAEYLEKVWEVVGRTALEHVLGTAEARARNSAAGALEEDARLTALFLWTLQSTNQVSGSGSLVSGSQPETDFDDSDDEEEEAVPKSTPKGFSLIFDVARRFAQPLGIILPHWEGRIIETKKGIVRLLSLTERAKILFGEVGAQAVADRIESDRGSSPQLSLFPEMEVDVVPRIRGRGKGRDSRQVTGVADQALQTKREATTLDRVHAAMLLQAGGRANALRSLLKAEQDRSPDFLRLANALSALYPKSSEEKRLLDAMLLAVPR